MGVTNVGTRPTFELDAAPNVETLILDFDDKLYHETLRMEFMKFLRPERRFEKVEDLIAQIKDDEAQTRRIFEYGP
jgi:riboflavin kinase/FMN adenylyltransferase